MWDGAKIWETKSNMWESGFEPKGERDQFRREKGPEYFRQGPKYGRYGQTIVYSGLNMGNTSQYLKAEAKIWKIEGGIM